MGLVNWMGRVGGVAPAGCVLDWFWLCRRASVLYLMYEEVGAGWWAKHTTGGGGGGGGGEGGDGDESSDWIRPSV